MSKKQVHWLNCLMGLITKLIGNNGRKNTLVNQKKLIGADP